MMMLRLIYLNVGLLFFTHVIYAQSKQVVTCGTIKYERKVSLKKKLTESADDDEEGMDFWMEEMVKKAPVSVSDQFILQFNADESRYYFDKKITDTNFRMWGQDDVASKNTVYKNYRTGEQASLKLFYDTDFLLLDSIKKFDWKLTREFRDIAGYECRKATTIINDSLYVIAFYTDDIVCNGGPEGFGGLPGTILGIVMPRLYTSWFATSVEPFCDPKTTILKPSKGKKTTQKELIALLQERYGRYKKWYHNMIWNIVI